MNSHVTLIRQLLLAVAALLCCTAAAAAGITLTGFVVDAKTSRPVAKANISAAGGLARRNAQTDRDGRFSLPLAPAVTPGQAIRLRVDSDDYVSIDLEVPASADVPLRLEIAKHESGIRASIDEVRFLTNGSERTFEILVSNKGEGTLWLKRLVLSARVARVAMGFTGFIARADFDVQLQSNGTGSLEGTAAPTGSAGAPYPVRGSFAHETDTRRKGEQSWFVTFTTEFPARIDANDKLLVRLNMSKPTIRLAERKDEGEMLAMTLGRMTANELTIAVAAENTSPLRWKGSAIEFLEWFTGAAEEVK